MDSSSLLHSPAGRQWQTIGIRHHHGITIPLFSLHSSQSCGIGDFTDLLSLIDWCADLGLDVIQLLPLNDTGLDSSPYNALSAFALNPLYISLSSLPYLEEYPELVQDLKKLPNIPHSHKVNYALAREVKDHFLRKYYKTVCNRLHHSLQYQKFLKRSSYWLKGYALFKAVCMSQNWQYWRYWPQELQHPSLEKLDHLFSVHAEEVDWHIFLQYLADSQLYAAKQHAQAKGVFLMGDIPILISPHSADVWLHPSLFELDRTAGAPPDFFSAEGQNWGFPLYNWEVMHHHGDRWWIERLHCASRYYHIYRIDHIVGFFRIWAIPLGKSGKEGEYEPKDEHVWISHGRKIMLMMLHNCDMLPIGEDLGTIPPEVRVCLKELGICGTKVMRWERKWKDKGQFIPIQEYPYDSMTTVSTHDSETLQLWWKYHSDEAQLYAEFKGWNYQSELSRDAHYSILWDSHHSHSLFHVNLLPEYLALIPGLSWDKLEDERINIPGIASLDNWSYRLRPSLEQLKQQDDLKTLIQDLIR